MKQRSTWLPGAESAICHALPRRRSLAIRGNRQPNAPSPQIRPNFATAFAFITAHSARSQARSPQANSIDRKSAPSVVQTRRLHAVHLQSAKLVIGNPFPSQRRWILVLKPPSESVPRLLTERTCLIADSALQVSRSPMSAPAA